ASFSIFSAAPALFSSAPSVAAALLLSSPLLNALANEFPEVFDLLCRLTPEVLKRIRIDAYSISSAPASVPANLIFVICRELPAGHRRNRERAVMRQRCEDRSNFSVYFLEAGENSIVLLNTK